MTTLRHSFYASAALQLILFLLLMQLAFSMQGMQDAMETKALFFLAAFIVVGMLNVVLFFVQVVLDGQSKQRHVLVYVFAAVLVILSISLEPLLQYITSS